MTAVGDALRLALRLAAEDLPHIVTKDGVPLMTPERAAVVAESTILAAPGAGRRPWLLVLNERILDQEGQEAIGELTRRCAERGCFAAVTARDGEIRLLDDVNMADAGVVRTDLVREVLREFGGPGAAAFDQVMRNLGDTPGGEPPTGE